jgi:acetyl-CoA carboxylase biotin carboxyl carrier protein
MDIRKVKKLIELVEESDIDEIEIKEGDEYVRISRRRSPSPSVDNPSAPPVAHVVESPMVGTYYQRPAAGAQPFVKPGQRVELGDTLCIVEAMKMMNPITADRAGCVGDILVEDGQAVEFGQHLLTLV